MKFNKEQIACFSDIHIGVHQASSMWHTISLNYARWLRDVLKERGIKDIVIPGDVLDDRNEIAVTTLHYLPQFFRIFEEFNIIIVVGNHDCYYSKRSDVHSLETLDEWPNITVIDSLTTVTLHEKVISFCPWHTPIEDIPQSDIIFGHFDIQSFKMAGYKVNEHGVRSADLLNKASLIVTGHYHLTQDRVYKNGKILYLGSPYQLNWGEAETPKGVYIIDIDTNDTSFITNDVSPKHKKILLSELLAIGKLTKEIQDEFNGNIIKFVVDVDASQRTIDELVKKFYLLKPLELKIEYEYTQRFDLEDHEMEFQGVDVRSDMTEFVKTLEGIEIKEEVINYLIDIYERAEVLVT